MNYNQGNKKQREAKTFLATFISDTKHLCPSLKKIFSCFSLEFNRVFIYNDILNEGKKIITYNVFYNPSDGLDISQVYNTIRINRKKESNTLYTINGLNSIIREELNGMLDNRHIINWENYEDRLIHFDEKIKKLIVTPIVLTSITNQEFFEKNNTTKKLYQ